MNVRLLLPLVGLAVALLAPPAAPGADTVVVDRKKIARDEQTLTRYFERLEAPAGRIRHLSDERLARSFPGYSFFQVRYAAGSARRLPGGLREVNLFVVEPDGKVQNLNEKGAMAPLFRARFVDVRSERRAGEAARSLVVLVAARHPGVVFGPAELKTSSDATGVTVLARMPVREGGTGHVEAEVHFNKKGTLDSLARWSKLTPSSRVVRTAVAVKRATTAAREELVRLKLPADTLRQVTDVTEADEAFAGHVFFTFADVEAARKWGGARRRLVVVEPEGRAVVLGTARELVEYVKAAYDPITTDEQARSAMRLFLRLLQLTYPEVTFRPAKESIRVEHQEGGVRVVTAKLEAEAGARGHLDVSWRIGKLGRLAGWGVQVRAGGKP